MFLLRETTLMLFLSQTFCLCFLQSSVFHFADPDQPQQSQASFSSHWQAATFVLCAFAFSSILWYLVYLPSCCAVFPVYDVDWVPTPPSSISSSVSSKGISRARSNVQVDPLPRVAYVPVMLRSAKLVSQRRPSPVEESLSVSNWRSRPSKTCCSWLRKHL